MKTKFLAAVLPALLASVAPSVASAFEIQADHVRSEDGRSYLYRENVEIRFAPEESFEISADEITEADGVAVYSGQVRITYKSMQLETDTARVERGTGGSHVITAQNADLTVE